MARVPSLEQQTVAAIRSHYELAAEDWRRPHLGASQIGKECSRHLWYGFRWALDPDRHPQRPLSPKKLEKGWRAEDNRRGRLLRLFERGQREEAWVVEDLRAIGCEVWDADEHGRQWRVSLAPHFGGSCDGVVRGLPEAPKTPHVLEVKTSNRDRFAELVAKGVRHAKPEHYAQMQVYMLGLQLDRAFYVAVCKDDDRIYTERVHFDRPFAELMVERAKRIVAAPEPPIRVGERHQFVCRFCDHYELCHGRTLAERNCRTCLSSTPMPDGTWRCDHLGRRVSDDEQRKGCDEHLYIPALLWWHGKAVDATDGDDRWVLYEDGTRDQRKEITR